MVMPIKVVTNMPLAVKKKQERTISRCGNSAVLYLPKGYFIPGENVNLDLAIDFDGNVKLTLKKCLFNFNCDKIRTALKKGFNIEHDETVDGIRNLNASAWNLSINCIGYTQELEPTYITICRLFDAINSAETYTGLTGFLEKLKVTCPDAYIEPEGNIDAVKIYTNPKKFHLENEVQAVELLRKTGKRLNYSVIVRFSSKKHTIDEVTQVLGLLSQNDDALLKQN